ncbi:hypothetical protein [Endozoicomonas numazuensis]|nr:hypothetical protein [Endozoicomonas numazuensis]
MLTFDHNRQPHLMAIDNDMTFPSQSISRLDIPEKPLNFAPVAIEERSCTLLEQFIPESVGELKNRIQRCENAWFKQSEEREGQLIAGEIPENQYSDSFSGGSGGKFVHGDTKMDVVQSKPQKFTTNEASDRIETPDCHERRRPVLRRVCNIL